MITEQQLVDAGYETFIISGRIWYTSDRIGGIPYHCMQILRDDFCPYCGASKVFANYPYQTHTPDSYSYNTYECGVMAAFGIREVFTVSGRTDECAYVSSSSEEDDVI